ncbi:MAG: hypothetical protein K2N84_02975 [Clostridia bacterium]|nr:hypothetical protein [Clostridia bacterium]
MAETTCALTVNGVYLGIVDGFERTCELEPADRVFCELKACDRMPVSFFFDEDFLINPPPQIKLYFTEHGVAVYAENFAYADQTLRVLWQKRFGNALLTLCTQGNLQLNLQCNGEMHLVELPEALTDCQASPIGDDFLLEGSAAFARVSREGKIILFSEGKVLERGQKLRAEVPFHDSAMHTAVCAWEGDELVECKVRTASEPQADTFALAFFESILIGADPLPFLHETLSEKADSLREFLGDFHSVVLTETRDRVGLVYKRKERIYDLRYFRIELDDGKIKNITGE